MKINDFGALASNNNTTAMVQETPLEIIDPRQFLDFEQNKVQQITLDQLKMTNKENRGDDNTQPHGIYHFALIQHVLDMCNEHGYDAEVYDLFATNNRDKQTPGVSLYPELEKQYGSRAVQAHTLRRVYANIRLTNFDDDDLTTNLAISYTQKGIQVGFGSMVKICHNQNMMGEGRFVADYKINNHYASGDAYKTDLTGILAQIGTWLTDAQHIFIEDKETIERMKNSVLTAEQLYVIIGMLTAIRVAKDTNKKEIKYKGGVYPLNQMQICQLTESLLVEQKHKNYITAWDFYNAATELYKPHIVDQGMIMPENLAMMEFMRQQEIF